MASNNDQEDLTQKAERLILGTTIPDTDNHVTVIETQGDADATDGSIALEFIELSGDIRRGSPQGANEQYVGIVTPGPNQEFTPFLDGFLKLVRKIENGNVTDSDYCNLPSGVRLYNNRIINVSSSKEYREIFEFETTELELGEGNSGEPLRVVKDNMNGIAHALKSYQLDKGVVIIVDLEKFNENEIRCWIDQNKSEYVPELYMFQVQNDKVMLHMELLGNVMTLNYLIFKHRPTIIATQPSLLKPLSLHIFRLLLCVMREFHRTGWTHNDLHGENVLVRISSDGPPKIYILDFGKAERSDDIKQDMEDIAALFEGMLMGHEKKTAREQYARILFSSEDKTEISDLITRCSFLVQEMDLPKYIRLVESSLVRAKERFGHDDKTMFKRITAVISGEPGGSLDKLSDDKDGERFPSLPSPPKSPLSPKKPLPMEDETNKHLPASVISLDTQIDTGNDSEVYHSHDLEEMEFPGVKVEAETSDSLDGRGDGSTILTIPLSKLEVGSTEQADSVSLVANLPANSELVTSRHVDSERSRIHLATTSEEVSSDEDDKNARNTSEGET